jgi:hypothetical protein
MPAYLHIVTSKRPAKMMKPDSPFFLRLNHVSDRQPHHAWFTETAMGANHLYGLTKNMIKSCPSEWTLLFDFVFSGGFPLPKTSLPTVFDSSLGILFCWF